MARSTIAPAVKPRRRMDARLALGSLIIVASVAAGYIVISSSRATTEVYVTRTSVVAGNALNATNLELVAANLAQASAAYVRVGSLPDGAVATRTIGAGEFLPLGSVGRTSAVTSTRLVVDISSGLPADTPPGTAVDVWATVTDPFGESPSSSSIVVPGATFVRTVDGDSLASDAVLRAELLIPRSTLRSLLVAQGDGARIVVVPTVSQAG